MLARLLLLLAAAAGEPAPAAHAAAAYDAALARRLLPGPTTVRGRRGSARLAGGSGPFWAFWVGVRAFWAFWVGVKLYIAIP